MAYQAGTLRLKGKLGDLSFYYNKQCGYLVRQKGGPSKEQIANGRNFVRIRENNTEFSLAVSIGKLFRRGVKASGGLSGDSNVSQRLTGLLVRIGKTDLSAIRGMRNPKTVFNEPTSRGLLKSFAFYATQPLASIYTSQIHCDTVTGSIVFTGPVSSEFFRVPKAATHVQIKAAVVELDFDNKSYKVYPAPVYIAALENSMSSAEFACEVDTINTHLRIGVVAIQFLQEKNGELYLLKDEVSLGIV